MHNTHKEGNAFKKEQFLIETTHTSFKSLCQGIPVKYSSESKEASDSRDGYTFIGGQHCLKMDISRI